jgi:hypothetical protein
MGAGGSPRRRARRRYAPPLVVLDDSSRRPAYRCSRDLARCPPRRQARPHAQQARPSPRPRRRPGGRSRPAAERAARGGGSGCDAASPRPRVGVSGDKDYSGTPLHRKLGIKEGHRVVALSPPGDLGTLLGDLPPGVRVTTRLAAGTDVLILFANEAPGSGEAPGQGGREARSGRWPVGGLPQEVVGGGHRSHVRRGSSGRSGNRARGQQELCDRRHLVGRSLCLPLAGQSSQVMVRPARAAGPGSNDRKRPRVRRRAVPWNPDLSSFYRTAGREISNRRVTPYGH